MDDLLSAFDAAELGDDVKPSNLDFVQVYLLLVGTWSFECTEFLQVTFCVRCGKR